MVKSFKLLWMLYSHYYFKHNMCCSIFAIMRTRAIRVDTSINSGPGEGLAFKEVQGKTRL